MTWYNRHDSITFQIKDILFSTEIEQQWVRQSALHCRDWLPASLQPTQALSATHLANQLIKVRSTGHSTRGRRESYRLPRSVSSWPHFLPVSMHEGESEDQSVGCRAERFTAVSSRAENNYGVRPWWLHTEVNKPRHKSHFSFFFPVLLWRGRRFVVGPADLDTEHAVFFGALWLLRWFELWSVR